MFNCDELGLLHSRIDHARRKGWMAANRVCNGLGRRSLRGAALAAAHTRHELARLEAATQNFSLYFFWTDLPWAPLGMLDRMLRSSWRTRVVGGSGGLGSSGGLHAAESMSLVEAVERFAPARLHDGGLAFSQLVIVQFMILHHGFRLRDVTEELELSPTYSHVFGSFFEMAPREEPRAKWERILALLDPLWVPGYEYFALHSTSSHSSSGNHTAPQHTHLKAALAFNVDRAERHQKPLRHYAKPCEELRPLGEEFLSSVLV